MRRRRQESGFALLLVFLMASVIAITLYMELPREAFESQRQKEQMLIERGEQYKLAIRRFVQANPNRWPGNMDELESFNNRHFLRHRYKDPMTGKDEWRLIHIQNGILTDSKLNKNKTDQTKNSNPNTFIQEMAGLNGTPNGPGTKNSAMRTRPSDANAGNLPGMSSGAPPDPNNPNQPAGVPPLPNGATGTTPGTGPPVIPGSPLPGQPGYQGSGSYPVTVGSSAPGMPGMPGTQPGGAANQQSGGGFIGNQPGLGSAPASGGVTTGPGGQPLYPGQQPYPGAPGMPVNSQTGGVSPYPGAPGANGAPPNQAVNMINNILTQPRPGGMPSQFGGNFPQGGVPVGGGGLGGGGQTTATIGGGFGTAPGSPVGSPMGGQTIGGGIAGVASNDDEDSIMEYGDQTNYSLWEFVFDPTKWHAPPNPNVGTIGTSVASMGSSANNLGQSGSGINTGITAGTNTGISGASPMGNQPGGGMPGGGQPGQPGQTGTGGMPSSSSSTFGSGGLPDIRPGRR